MDEVVESGGVSLEDELISFRQEWHEEIVKEGSEDEDIKINQKNKWKVEEYKLENSIEQKAAHLFLKGVQCEKEGHFEAAVYFYRQAVHLVPDIEFKIAEYQVTQGSTLSNESNEDNEDESFNVYNEEIDGTDLASLNEQLEELKISGLCSPAQPQQGLHISTLPTELLMVVFRWVVSTDIDVHSLETLACVCKWFYACAKDEELWKSICIRVWGINCTSHSNYMSWRHMFIEKPRVKYSGLYISSNTYIRIGEETVGNYYKPCHLVEYYKYLRFFSDGTVLLFTSTDEPATVVQLLNQPPYRDPYVYKGFYRQINENEIRIFYTRVTTPTPSYADNYRRRGRIKEISDPKESQFQMFLTLHDTRKRKNHQMQWKDYTYIMKNKRTGVPIGVESDISIAEFKPFFFSHVRSYNLKSHASL